MDSPPEVLETEDPAIARLTHGVAAGLEESFRELYDRYHARLFRLLMVLTGGEETLAREVVQTVVLTAAAKLGPLAARRRISGAAGWRRSARQHCSKRRAKLRREGAILTFGDYPETAAEAVPWSGRWNRPSRRRWGNWTSRAAG